MATDSFRFEPIGHMPSAMCSEEFQCPTLPRARQCLILTSRFSKRLGVCFLVVQKEMILTLVTLQGTIFIDQA